MCLMCATQGLSASWQTFDHDLASSGGGSFAAAPADAGTVASVGLTGEQNIDGLLYGTRWSGAITYSFPDARADYEVTYSEADNGFGAVSFNQQQAARYILEGTSPYSGGPKMTLTAFESFTEATISDAGSDGADIRIAKSSEASPTAYAYIPHSSYYGGDVWFGTSSDYSNPRVGNYQYATMLHELGHALGLKHGHTADGLGSIALSADRDSMEFSVMTYRPYIGASSTRGYTNETYGYAQTYMMYDIAALQQLYGADFTTNSGSTVYSWSAVTGETFVNGVGQGAPGTGTGGSSNRIFETIWDGGGIDTYDLSNYTTNLAIDLNPGSWSLFSAAQRANLGDGHYARANVFNALQFQGDSRSLIENAIGGSGADTIVGNMADNRLTGGAGNDLLEGSGGANTAVYSGNFSDYHWSQNADSSLTIWDVRAGSADGIDTLRNIQYLAFRDQTIAVADHLGTVDTSVDTGNAYPWSSRTLVYDGAGRLSTVTTEQDDGTTFYTNYNLAKVNPWNYAVSTYDAADRLSAVSIYKDVLLVTSYDAANRAPWKQAITGYDSAGRRDYVTVIYDDGTSAYTVYDDTTKVDYTIYTYDMLNRLVHTFIQYDDGTSLFI
jgi:serralysin